MEITKLAQKHFVKLLLTQPANTEIRVFISNAGTARAHCGVCFCYPDSLHLSSDMIVSFDFLSVRIEKRIFPFLKSAVIDFVLNGLDSQLTFKAPFAKGFMDVVTNVKENFSNVSLQDKIRDILELQINPQLSAHGGSVSLVDVTEDFVVILKFLGGCNGCAMANYTMQLGIETTLKKIFPELKGVRDVTEHYHGSHSYY